MSGIQNTIPTGTSEKKRRCSIDLGHRAVGDADTERTRGRYDHRLFPWTGERKRSAGVQGNAGGDERGLKTPRSNREVYGLGAGRQGKRYRAEEKERIAAWVSPHREGTPPARPHHPDPKKKKQNGTRADPNKKE